MAGNVVRQATVGVLRSIGAPVTPQNIKFMQEWQAREGGHTNNSATFNPWNTTQGTQYPSMNSVGVRQFPNLQTGIKQTAATLLNGHYGDLVGALRSGNPFGKNVSRGLATWGTGSAWLAGQGGPAVTPGAAPVTLSKPQAPVLPHFKISNANPFAQVQNIIAAEQQYAQTGQVGQIQRVVDPGGTLDPPIKLVNGQPSLPPAKQHSQLSGGLVDKVLAAAHSQVGEPYQFGAESPGKAFDCSGLVQWAYGQMGVNIPRTSEEQFKVGSHVKWGHFQPGDLIFVAGSDGTKSNPGHVVMYVGNGKVIAAPHTGTVVQYQDVNNFKSSFAGARRVIQ